MKSRRQVRASYTVEAALLIPFILMLFLFLMVFGMYERDLAAARAYLTRLAVAGRNLHEYDTVPQSTDILYERQLAEGIFSRLLQDQTKEEEKLVLKKAGNREADLFWVSQSRGTQITITDQSVTASMEIYAGISVPLFSKLGRQLMHQELRVTKTCKNAADWTRIAATVLETGQKIRGAEEVLDKVSKLLQKINK